MKIECSCGAWIHDSSDYLPWKGYVIPDQAYFQLTNAIDVAIEHPGPDAHARAAQCHAIHALMIGLMRPVWQCRECGRLVLDDRDHRSHGFLPEGAHRELLREYAEPDLDALVGAAALIAAYMGVEGADCSALGQRLRDFLYGDRGCWYVFLEGALTRQELRARTVACIQGWLVERYPGATTDRMQTTAWRRPLRQVERGLLPWRTSRKIDAVFLGRTFDTTGDDGIVAEWFEDGHLKRLTRLVDGQPVHTLELDGYGDGKGTTHQGAFGTEEYMEYIDGEREVFDAWSDASSPRPYPYEHFVREWVDVIVKG